MLKSKIFRAYDIRGEAFVDFDEDGFMSIAQAFGTYIRQKHNLTQPKVFVSGDDRQSMPVLYPAVIAGLESAGCGVTWGGALPTPINYFAFHEGNFDASIQISASHNPAQDNGLKLLDRTGAVCGNDIQKIAQISVCQSCKYYAESSNYSYEEDFFYSEKYLQKLLNITSEQEKQDLYLDFGNAIPGVFYPEIFRAFGHQVQTFYADIDTTFPNHQPDPERPENLAELLETMSHKTTGIGMAFDGDGDRVGIVMAGGKTLSADQILYVLARDFLLRKPYAKIVIDAMSSDTLIDKLTDLGAEVILSKTGHSFIEEAMHEHGALLGGEQSGHFMFGEDFYGHDDACLAGLRFIQAMQNIPSVLTEITEAWPQLIEYSEKIKVPDEQKFEILDQYVRQIIKQYPDASTLDGVRVSLGNNEWVIVRCSNTSPKISIRIEATDDLRLSQLRDLFERPLLDFLG